MGQLLLDAVQPILNSVTRTFSALFDTSYSRSEAIHSLAELSITNCHSHDCNDDCDDLWQVWFKHGLSVGCLHWLLGQ